MGKKSITTKLLSFNLKLFLCKFNFKSQKGNSVIHQPGPHFLCNTISQIGLVDRQTNIVINMISNEICDKICIKIKIEIKICTYLIYYPKIYTT